MRECVAATSGAPVGHFGYSVVDGVLRTNAFLVRSSLRLMACLSRLDYRSLPARQNELLLPHDPQQTPLDLVRGSHVARDMTRTPYLENNNLGLVTVEENTMESKRMVGPLRSKALFTFVGGVVLANPAFTQEQVAEELEEIVEPSERRPTVSHLHVITNWHRLLP